jgi:phospholipid/cholesterol/gamma-HCH transport system ATP-binding protein
LKAAPDQRDCLRRPSISFVILGNEFTFAGSELVLTQRIAATVTDSPSSDNLVEINDVHYSVGGRAIFKGLTLSVPKGKITAIMGPSGTGKTTLLRLITGQIRPVSGSVRVDGQEVGALTRNQLYALRQRMGMLFQNGALLTDISVFENVAFPVREHTQLPEALIKPLVLSKLQAVGLRGAAQLMPHELSGGMARRVALARAMVRDPELLIYDEPFAGLDPISMGVILRLLRKVNDALGITSMVVSHDVEEIAQVADLSYILADGKVVASGSPKALKDDQSELVRQFMNGLPDGPVAFHYPARDYYSELLS